MRWSVVTAVLFWDIDGTLIATGRAGIYAWEEALYAEAGVRADLSEFETAGLTDFEIGRRLLASQDICGGDDVVTKLVRRYEARLPASLPRRQGRVLPHVREILESLSRLPDVNSLLLTGNTRLGAAAKLSYYGLDHFFAAGAFSDDGWERPSIARVALQRAAESGGIDRGQRRVYVIGDTPHDIHCGRSIGARTVAVATGSYTEAALLAHDPWMVLPELPPAPEFIAALLD